MTSTPGIARLIRAVGRGDAEAIQRHFARTGWGAAAREVEAPVAATRLLELSWGDEPQALVVLGRDDEATVSSWGYSREAPYALSWSGDRVALLDSRYWRLSPGDSPLLSADLSDSWAVDELLSFLRPSQLLDDVPAGYGAPEKRQRELHETLAAALRDLRLQVAQAGLLADLDVAKQDAEVLRLFHQLLFIRFQEDRGQAASSVLLSELTVGDDVRAVVARALADYCANLNSELFAPVSIDVSTLPAQPLADVLAKLVEPWKRLRLDFSVSRSEIAGRLYQSYLASLPAPKPRRRQGVFFDDAHIVDAQSRSASYYTPPGLARLVAERALRPWLRSARPTAPAEVRVLDPACGSGAFLIAAYRLLVAYFTELKGSDLTPAERSEILLESIFGADVDERAIELARVQLLEEADVRGRLPVLGENLLLGDSLLSPPGAPPAPSAVDWSGVCADGRGFDVVLTNPPFRARYKMSPGPEGERDERLRELYPKVSVGHADYSHLFVDLALRLLGRGGAAGFVLPLNVLRVRSGAPVRRLLAQRGIRSIVDFDAGRLFEASTYVCAIATGRARATELVRAKSPNRDGRVLLEAAERPGSEAMRRQKVSRRVLQEQADRDWDSFRLQWELELRGEVEAALSPLVPPDHPERVARYGTKPGAQKKFTIQPEEWSRAAAGVVAIGDRRIPEIYAPPLVKGRQLSPFHFADSGARIFVPFDPDGSLATEPAVLAELKRRGGLPPNPQHGDLRVLRGPKLLLRTLAREASTVADTTGRLMPLMGEAGAIALRLGDVDDQSLFAYEALLNSSFYQWWIGGMGQPRRGGWFALNCSLAGEIPIPSIAPAELRVLDGIAAEMRDALKEEKPLRRRARYGRVRAELDEIVLTLLGASPRLRSIVAAEVMRVA